MSKRKLDEGYSSFSIRKMTLTLKGKGFKRSPQVIKRLLLELVDEDKIREVKKEWSFKK